MQNNETISSSDASPAPFDTAVQGANQTYVKEILADPVLINKSLVFAEPLPVEDSHVAVTRFNEGEFDTNAKISNELTIEPALGGSMKNAGLDSETSFPVLAIEGQSSLQTRGGGGKSMEFNQMLALTAGLAAGTGLPMPAFNLPSRLRQERKHYDPKPETAESRNVRSAWNFAIEQERQAKAQYKKAVPREERILQKKKKK